MMRGPMFQAGMVILRTIQGSRSSSLTKAMVAALLLHGVMLGSAQTLPASTTSLTATPSPLKLPGTVQVTSIVNQTPASGAVPTGTVNFYSDATTLLGSAPLKILPATQAFTGGPTVAAGSSNAAALATVTLAPGTAPVTVSGDSTNGLIAMYQLNSGYTAVTTYTYTYVILGAGIFAAAAPAQTSLDSVVSGYFLQPKSSGVQSFLVHENFYGYLVFDGSTTSAALNPPQQVSPSGCQCSNPNDFESISIDDFDGDGYSDVGALVTGQGGQQPYEAGVALNAGASNPGFLGGTTVNGFTATGFIPASTGQGCPIAVTTGHFTSAAVAQLAVLEVTPASGSCSSLAAGDPLSVNLYQLGSTKTSLVAVGTPLNLPDTNAFTLSSADLNGDGFSDLIIGESITSGNTISGGVITAMANGDGSFKTPSALTSFGSPPGSFTVNDFNGDGHLDFAVTGNDAFTICLTDGAGNIAHTEGYVFNPAITATPGGIASADFNGDGLADLVVIPGSAAAAYPDFSYVFNSASAQAALSITPTAATLPPGNHNLTADYPGDGNFAKSVSPQFALAVTQTTPLVTWPTIPPLEYGAPLGATQLNATASVLGSFSYAPGAGTVLAPGRSTVTATFAPTDSYDYSPATATQTITVASPSLTGITPSSVSLGAPDTTITITGQGLVKGAIVQINGSPAPTTWVSLNELTAVFPQSSQPNPGTGTAGSYTITVIDPNAVAVSGSQAFTVLAGAATAQASVPSTVQANQQSAITLTVSPYPVPVTATLTITFTPAPPGTVTDTTVGFANGTTTEVVNIPPNSSATIPPIAFSSGTTAGTITLSVQFTAGGVDITPPSLVPIAISVPASPPGISSATLSSNGNQMTLVINGFSPTRDLSSAQFHFTPVAGKSLKTTDLTVQLGSQAATYYSSSSSDSNGTTFVYTQPFAVSTDANDVGSVTFTLTNSQGTSQPGTANLGPAQ